MNENKLLRGENFELRAKLIECEEYYKDKVAELKRDIEIRRDRTLNCEGEHTKVEAAFDKGEIEGYNVCLRKIDEVL